MKLVTIKSDKHKYSKEQIQTIFDLLNQNEDTITQIANRVNMSNRKVKQLRYINNKGVNKDKELLLQERYLISSIESSIKYRIKNQKKGDNKK